MAPARLSKFDILVVQYDVKQRMGPVMGFGLAMFWFALAAILAGLPKIAGFMLLAFFVTLFFRAPIALLLGVILGVSLNKKDEC